jgi:arylsulfatase A-like enzyme
MPLVIKFALGSNVRPRAIEDIVLNIDIAPTILDLAGIGVPPDMQGVSLKVFQDADPFHHWRKAMYYRLYVNEYNVPPHYGIRSDRYKLIRFDGSGDPLNKLKEPVCYDHWELYDLQDDPDELINLADSRDHAGILSALQKDLHSLKTVLGDTIK